MDIIQQLASQNFIKQVEVNIEKSAILHLEFWSTLQDDSPELSKLNSIGSKINKSI